MKNKFLTLVALGMMSATSLMAEGDGLIGSLQSEGQGALGFTKVIIVILILTSFFGAGIGGAMPGKSIAKKQLKNEQEEDAGYKVMGYSALGGLAGAFVGYIVIGWFGSMMNPASDGEVNFAKGTNYIISKVFSDIETVASGS